MRLVRRLFYILGNNDSTSFRDKSFKTYCTKQAKQINSCYKLESTTIIYEAEKQIKGMDINLNNNQRKALRDLSE